MDGTGPKQFLFSLAWRITNLQRASEQRIPGKWLQSRVGNSGTLGKESGQHNTKNVLVAIGSGLAQTKDSG